MVLGALSILLELEADLTVVGTAADGEEAFASSRRSRPTCC